MNSLNLLNLGKGRLSYTLSLLAIVWGVVGLIFGWIGTEEALVIIYVGLAMFGIRRALPKAE